MNPDRLDRLIRMTRALLRLRLTTTDEPRAQLVEEVSRLRDALSEDPPELRTEEHLRDRLGLSDGELYTLVVMTAIALDDEAATLATRGGELTSRVLLEVIHGAANHGGYRLLEEHGALRRLCLIERSDGGGRDLHESRYTWSVTRRVIGWLLGDATIDPAVRRFARLGERGRELDRLAVDDNARVRARAAIGSPGAIIVANGAPGSGRRSLLSAAATEANVCVLEIDAKRLSKDAPAFAKELRILARECRLFETMPLIRNVDALGDDRDHTRLELVGSELVAELATSVLATSGPQRPQLRWDRPVISIEINPPTSAQRATLWRELIPEASESDADYLATQYPLAPAVMHVAAKAALARSVGRTLTPTDIVEGIRTVLDDKLGNFAKRVQVTQTWDDMVLEQEQVNAIMELIARIGQRRTVYEQWGFAAKVGRGLGVSALFSGPPGTGKTMAAALIAQHLGLELYRVDMGKMISKWIGETEKQLGELFDAAEAGHAILLFDEADSLFGKRTEVRSSNDRYANLETNYLLQRLETFTGICLLTSNHESNIDPAFQRRLALHLRFNVPDEDEREKLWRAMLPDAAPVAADLDFAGLARRFAMSGGYIKNAALRAAFLAAEEGVPISARLLEYAARLEYEGLGKIVAPIVRPLRNASTL
ncbi:MAG: AAA family ATPase [Kofleriaceae bacterium]